MRMKALCLASVGAILVQPLVFFLWFVLPILAGQGPFSLLDLIPISTVVIVVAALHLLVIGLPLYYILWYTKRTSWSFVTLVGFVAGTGLLVLASMPSWRRQSDEWIAHVQSVVHCWWTWHCGRAGFSSHLAQVAS